MEETTFPLIVIIAPASSPVSLAPAVIVVVALSPILSVPEVGVMVTAVMVGRWASTPGRLPASACVAVGPEGDFTTAEVEALVGAGARPITLGPLVLRCETAATYCLSVLSYECQSRGA